MALVTFVSGEGGDWIGMYVGGRLFEQGHSLNPAHIARMLIGMTVGGVEEFEVDQDWLEAECHLPPNLGDIPQEVRK